MLGWQLPIWPTSLWRWFLELPCQCFDYTERFVIARIAHKGSNVAYVRAHLRICRPSAPAAERFARVNPEFPVLEDEVRTCHFDVRALCLRIAGRKPCRRGFVERKRELRGFEPILHDSCLLLLSELQFLPFKD